MTLTGMTEVRNNRRLSHEGDTADFRHIADDVFLNFNRPIPHETSLINSWDKARGIN